MIIFVISTAVFGSLYIIERDNHKATKTATQMILRALEENGVKLELVEREKDETI